MFGVWRDLPPCCDALGSSTRFAEARRGEFNGAPQQPRADPGRDREVQARVRELPRSTILQSTAGRGSAWLERRVWDAEVAGSNPAAPIDANAARRGGRGRSGGRRPSAGPRRLSGGELRAAFGAGAAIRAGTAVGLGPGSCFDPKRELSHRRRAFMLVTFVLKSPHPARRRSARRRTQTPRRKRPPRPPPSTRRRSPGRGSGRGPTAPGRRRRSRRSARDERHHEPDRAREQERREEVRRLQPGESEPCTTGHQSRTPVTK